MANVSKLKQTIVCWLCPGAWQEHLDASTHRSCNHTNPSNLELRRIFVGWNISLHFIVYMWIVLRAAFFRYKSDPTGKWSFNDNFHRFLQNIINVMICHKASYDTLWQCTTIFAVAFLLSPFGLERQMKLIAHVLQRWRVSLAVEQVNLQQIISRQRLIQSKMDAMEASGHGKPTFAPTEN